MHFLKLAVSAFVKVLRYIATRTYCQQGVIIMSLILGSCPCLTCAVKIAQVGITEVIFSRVYNMDKAVRSYFDFISDIIDIEIQKGFYSSLRGRNQASTVFSSRQACRVGVACENMADAR